MLYSLNEKREPSMPSIPVIAVLGVTFLENGGLISDIERQLCQSIREEALDLRSYAYTSW